MTDDNTQQQVVTDRKRGRTRLAAESKRDCALSLQLNAIYGAIIVLQEAVRTLNGRVSEVDAAFETMMVNAMDEIDQRFIALESKQPDDK